MISISSLTENDIGRAIVYRSKGGDKIENGRLKSWNDHYIFGVYGEQSKDDNWLDYTGAATDPADLTFGITEGVAMSPLGPIKTVVYDPGREVVCDSCSKDYTDSNESGGFLFGSYGYGPCCAPRMRKTIAKYNEEWNIKGECPTGVSFADWIRSIR